MPFKVLLAFVLSLSIVIGALGQQPSPTPQTSKPDGKIVFSGEPTPVTINGQADPQRLTNVMKLQIGSDLIPGDYVCQIIVTDGPDNSKPRVASQWIDFEVVK